MRKKILNEVIREVLGPKNGTSEMLGDNPYRQYLTGVIIPKDVEIAVAEPDSEITTTGGEDFGAEEDGSEDDLLSWEPADLDPRMRPKSFGISFAVEGRPPEIRVCVTWARYSMARAKDGKQSWTRHPFHFIHDFALDKPLQDILVYDEFDGKIRLIVKSVTGNSATNAVVSLSNELEIDPKVDPKSTQLGLKSIFQPSIRVLLGPDTKPAELPRLGENQELRFLYREKLVRARGFMCSAIWKDIEYAGHLDQETIWPDGTRIDACKPFLDSDFRSEFIPMFPVPTPRFDWDETEFGPPPELRSEELSELWNPAHIDTRLEPLVRGLDKWVQENRQKATSDREEHTLMKLVDAQERVLDRVKRGVELIRKDSEARYAFCFANKVISLQHSWRGANPHGFEWRPFQLAFFLMNLDSLNDRHSADRAYVDLLWIPTGGGKTETYLALMAFTIALRRLKATSTKDGDWTECGTVILTRYTLRLLTVQQFRRTLRMVAAAELLRVVKCGEAFGWRPQEAAIEGDWPLGTTRISCGLWVGSRVTPNHLRYGEESALKVLQSRDSVAGEEAGEPAQVLQCPACDTCLSIPDKGLNPGRKTLFWVVRWGGDVARLRTMLEASIKKPVTAVNIVTDRRHSKGHATVGLEIQSGEYLTRDKVEGIWDDLTARIKDLQIASFTASRPGYFPRTAVNSAQKRSTIDFEILCPNPACPLNADEIQHHESPAFDLAGEDLVSPDDSGRPFNPSRPYAPRTIIPIPAYTVDEQLYCWCPSVVIGTADKVARLSFEPMAGTLFGNVNQFTWNHGFYRSDLLPRDTDNDLTTPNYKILPFAPPEMIIQDELHLIDGPLGSMFGLYESAVEQLIADAGWSPKYIASTATSKDAENQARRLFAKELVQFPPFGLTISDSFFVRELDPNRAWDDSVSGRIYVGLCAPGLGPNTPMTRVWSTMLAVPPSRRNDGDIKYYWTIVGYFNTIKSLGATWALYRENVVERLSEIMAGKPDSEKRTLDMEKVIELSGRISSTQVPQILSELEQAEDRPIDEHRDAVFTTSMFGTGVDIPHLSIMLVDGQPKTTSQYIQATGRVGRKRGGIVLTFLRASRPRDLSHYELFTGYHMRIYLDVEPPAVSPFSQGALDRASGPVIVAYLRNKRAPGTSWHLKDGGVVSIKAGEADWKNFIMHPLSSRLRIADPAKLGGATNHFQSQIDFWRIVSKKTRDLRFVEYLFNRPNSQPHDVVLGTIHHERAKKMIVYKKSPQSLRDLEETLEFEV